MERLDRAIVRVFGDANLVVDPDQVLIKQRSVSNHVLYRWKAFVEAMRLDSTMVDAEPLWGGGRKSGRVRS